MGFLASTAMPTVLLRFTATPTRGSCGLLQRTRGFGSTATLLVFLRFTAICENVPVEIRIHEEIAFRNGHGWAFQVVLIYQIIYQINFFKRNLKYSPFVSLGTKGQ